MTLGSAASSQRAPVKTAPKRASASRRQIHRLIMPFILSHRRHRMNGRFLGRGQGDASFEVGHRFEQALNGLGLMIGIDLNSQHGRPERHGGKRHRLHIKSTAEQELAGPESLLLMAHKYRN